MRCKVCGIRELATGDMDGTCTSCSNKSNNPVGWICPNCGNGMAPWIPSCNCNCYAINLAGITMEVGTKSSSEVE